MRVPRVDPISLALEGIRDACAPAASAGALADYIPELARADPSQFGLALASLDGDVYARRRRERALTIQSISKPFVYALALRGPRASTRSARASAPSRAASRSTPSASSRARAARQPAGQRGRDPRPPRSCAAASSAIAACLAAFAGRPLEVDEAVFASERRDRRPQPRDRPPDARRRVAARRRSTTTIDAYFRQCSLLVTATRPGGDGGDARQRRPQPGHRRAGRARGDRAARALDDGDVRDVRRRRRVDAARRAAGQERRLRRAAGGQPGAVRDRALQPAAGRARATASRGVLACERCPSASACTCCTTRRPRRAAPRCARPGW